MLICLLIIGSVQLKAQEGWIKQKIDQKVTVGFPVQPRQLNEASVGIRDKDDVTFIVTKLDLASLTKVTVEKFHQDVVTQDYADEFLEGMAPTMPKFKFSPIKIVKLKGLSCYQVVGRDEESKSTIFMNIYFLNGISYSLASIQPDGKPDKNRSIFLTNLFIEK